MQRKTIYWENVDVPDIIVRKCPNVFGLEYVSKDNPKWIKALPNSSYEREYYLGDGNCCLYGITYEEAKRRLAEWGMEI